MDIKRNVLWVIFLSSVFLLWNQWMISQGNPSFFSPPKPAASANSVANGKSDVPSTKGSASGGTVPGLANSGVAVASKGETVTITTDVFKADIDTLGGELKRLELLQFKDGIDQTKNQVLFDASPKHTYLAQSGLFGAAEFPNHKSLYVAKPGARSLDSANEVQLVLESEQNGVRLTKTFIFKRGDYQIGLRHQITNIGTAPVTPTLYAHIVHDGNKPAGDTYFLSTYTGPVLYTDAKKYEKLKFEEIEKFESKKANIKPGQELSPLHETQADNGWVALVQHFFVSALLPQDKTKREIYTEKVGENLYRIGYRLPLAAIAPDASLSVDMRLYSGPQITSLLEQTAPAFKLVKDYGMLSLIADPLFWIMNFIHSLLGNWGWTIIAFTILIKLAFFPLSAAGYRSMAKMKVVTPKMTALRERHKGDPAKMNQAMMELYRTEKINPLGGCFPILIQMPVFLALYWVLQASVEIRNAPWIGWIHDLAAPDPWYILPVLYAASMFATAKLNPPPADPMQAKMMLYMPLIFSVMFLFFPSGLVLYWVVNNILSLAQQWVITKNIEEGQKK